MKLEWDRRTDLPKPVFEEEDLLKALWIEEMVSGKFHCRKCGTDYVSKGWEALKGYMECEKILLEAKMENGIAPVKMINEEKSQVQIAKWSMFKHLMSLPERIILQAKLFKEKNKGKEDIKSGIREDEY